MHVLDLATLRVLFALTSFLLFVLVISVQHGRPQSSYGRWWALAMVFYSLSASTYLLEDAGLVTLALAGGRFLLVAGTQCFWASVHSLTRPVSRWWLLPLPLIALVSTYAGDPVADRWAGSAVFFGAMAVVLGGTAGALLKLPEGFRKLQTPMAWGMAAAAGFYFLRLVVLLTAGSDSETFKTYLGAAPSSVILILLVVVATFSMTVQSSELDAHTLKTRAAHEAQQAAGLRELLEKERSLAASLRELDRQKDDFISTVSHELRTPVTSILGYAIELEDSGLGTQEHGFAEAITRNAERLTLRIEELLAAGRVNSPDKLLEPCDVAATCAGIIEDLISSRTTHGVKLGLSRPPDPAWVLADPDSLMRIITNLVTNSLKFSPTDGAVRLSVERDDDDGLVIVTVSDEGPGIPPENLELVFARFYREPTAQSANTPGTGLGLPIARTLAQEMHGSLVLESDGTSGTTAVLTLPLYRITAQTHGLVPQGRAHQRVTS